MADEPVIADLAVQAHQEQCVDHQPRREQPAAEFPAATLSHHLIYQPGTAEGGQKTERELARVATAPAEDRGWR